MTANTGGVYLQRMYPVKASAAARVPNSAKHGGRAARRRSLWLRAGVFGTLSVAVLAGCSSSTSTDSPTSASASASTSAAPFDQAALQQILDETATEFMAPGMAALVRTPDGDMEAVYGTTTLGGDTEVTPDLHVRIGSNTKTWTGTVILQLAQEGKIDLQGPVSDYYDGVPNGENITIAQLLNMRSGLYNYSETLTLNEALDNEPDRVWAPTELLALGLANPPYFPPGEGYHYSNTNTVLLGLIAEKLEGKPIATIFEDRLFTPLNMAQTSFPPSDTAEIPAPFTDGYMYGTNVAQMDDLSLPPDQLAEAQAGTLEPNNVTGDNPSWTWTAGQGISTLEDLTTWVTALGTGSLLSPEMQQERLDSLQPRDPASGDGPLYGYGWASFGPYLGHTGEMPGYNSFMGYDPETKVSIVVWANLAPSADGQSVANTAARSIITAIGGGGS